MATQREPLKVLEDRWVVYLGCASAVLLAVLGLVGWRVLGGGTWSCLLQAWSSLDADACKAPLMNAIGKSVETAPTHETGLLGFTWNLPRFLVWVDNLAVDMYSIFFIGASTWVYREVTTLYSEPIAAWRCAITLSVLLVVAGAVADHSENFWLLAHMAGATSVLPSQTEVSIVANVSAWKFRLFGLNCLVAIAWWVCLRYRRRRFCRQVAALVGLAQAAQQASAGQGPQGAAALPHQIWQALLYLHFLKNALQQPALLRRLRVSFSSYALDRWLEQVVQPPTAETRRRLLDYLNDLAQRGFLVPQGRRYEVVRGELPRDLMVDMPPFGRIPVSEAISTTTAAGRMLQAATT